MSNTYFVIVSKSGAVDANGGLNTVEGRLFDNLAEAETAAKSFSHTGKVGRPRKFRIVQVSTPAASDATPAPAVQAPTKKARKAKAAAPPVE